MKENNVLLEIIELIKNTMIAIFPIVEDLSLENLIKSLPGGTIFLIIIGIIFYIQKK